MNVFLEPIKKQLKFYFKPGQGDSTRKDELIILPITFVLVDCKY